MGWYCHLLCGFAAPPGMLLGPWGKGMVEGCDSAAPSAFTPPPVWRVTISISGAAPAPRPMQGQDGAHLLSTQGVGGLWAPPARGSWGAEIIPPSCPLSGIQLMQPKKAPPSRARFKQSRARWWLAYTLLNNPSLTACRKTALSDPTANGTQLSHPKP